MQRDLKKTTRGVSLDAEMISEAFARGEKPLPGISWRGRALPTREMIMDAVTAQAGIEGFGDLRRYLTNPDEIYKDFLLWASLYLD